MIVRNHARVPTQFRFSFVPEYRFAFVSLFVLELRLAFVSDSGFGCETRTCIGDCGFVGLWFFPRPDIGPK